MNEQSEFEIYKEMRSQVVALEKAGHAFSSAGKNITVYANCDKPREGVELTTSGEIEAFLIAFDLGYSKALGDNKL